MAEELASLASKPRLSPACVGSTPSGDKCRGPDPSMTLAFK